MILPSCRRAPVPLPTDLMDRSDPSFAGAEYGDSMIRLARRVRCASLAAGLIIGGGAFFLGQHFLIQWLSAVGFPVGLMIFLILNQDLSIEWIYDFRPPVLILRSFSDKSLKEGRFLQPPDEAPTVTGGHDSYIWQLSQCIWDLARVVTMQDETPEANVTANAIILTPPDTGWQKVVLEVASQSWVVLMIPATTASCIEEFGLLRHNHLLHKTLVHMPGGGASTRNGHGHSGRDVDHAGNWERVRKDLAGRGLELPPYDSNGMLYVPTETFAIKSALPCQHLSQARALLARLVPRPSVLSEPLWNLVCFGDAYEASDPLKTRGGRTKIEPGARVRHLYNHLVIEHPRRPYKTG